MKTILHSVLLLSLASFCCTCLSQQPAQTERVFVVPFSHLDLFWGGNQEECLSRGNRIISRAIQLAEEHPEFRFLIEDEVFTANFMESHRGTPEAERLKSLVRSGHIEIAPKWAAIFQNLPRAEALVRNLVYGKRYAREVFGVDPLVAALTDIPGFTRQYPQMLRKSGIPYMVMTRMGPLDAPLFRWKSPDGSSVLLWDTINGYGWGVGLGLHHELDDAHLSSIQKQVGSIQSLTKGPVYLGWGTDLWAPNETLVGNLAVLNRRLAPATFQFATPTEYFLAAEKSPSIPEISGEIPSSWANVVSTMAPYWPATITATDTLVNAEKFAAINYALGYAPYPQQEFDLLWKKSLESMDHNLYGQGGDGGDERKVGFAQAAILQGGQILRESLRNIAERVQRSSNKATAVVVFNPLSWTRDDVVRAHVTLYGDVAPGDIKDYRAAMRLVDAQGNAIPFDVEQYSENMSRALTLVFTAQGVPSMGYKTYYIEPVEPTAAASSTVLNMDDDNDVKDPRRIVGVDVIENRFYRVTVDRATGRIEIFDKELGRIVSKDIEIAGAEERGGNTLNIEPRTGRTVINVIRSVKLIRHGSSETTLRISGDLAGIPVTQELTLYRDLRKIELENKIDWKPGRYMKIQQVFPLDMPGAEIRNGIPFGSASQADAMPKAGPHSGDEVKPEVWKDWRQVQDWVSAGTADWSLTVTADHQMFTVNDQAIRGDMLRGTRYNPLKTVIDGHIVLVEQPPAGTYVYRYSISSGKGNWAANKAWQQGMGFNMPLIGVIAEDELSPKTLPAEQSFLSIPGDTLTVTALKKADQGDGIVVRFFEAAGESAETSVRFLGRQRAIRSVNMLEEPTSSKEEQTLRVNPYEIDTVEIPAVPKAAK
jgi:alpha-mannosidase